MLAARIAGLDSVMVRSPLVRLDWREGPERDWLVQRIETIGARLARDELETDLVIHPVADDSPRLALAPGAAGWTERGNACLNLALPPRFDALLGAWCALALPVLAHLAGARLASTPSTLARKIASAVGWTEVAMLRIEGDRAHPLAVGDAPLGRIAQADAFRHPRPRLRGCACRSLAPGDFARQTLLMP